MAKAAKKVEKVTVVLELSEEEAKALKSVLVNEVEWKDPPNVAEAIFDALDDLELG